MNANPTKKKTSRTKAAAARAAQRSPRAGRNRNRPPDYVPIAVSLKTGAAGVVPNDVLLAIKDSVIVWYKAKGSEPFNFVGLASTVVCPIGTPVLDADAESIVMYYDGDDGDFNWMYRVVIQPTCGGGPVVTTGGKDLLGGSTIRNH